MNVVELQTYFVRAWSRLARAGPGEGNRYTSFTNLYYHDFTSGPAGSFLEVQRPTVGTQLETLSRRFAILRLSDCLAQIFEKGHIEAEHPPTSISIDDALLSFDSVLPYFEKFAVPVVLFVPVGLCLAQDTLDGLRSRCFRYHAEFRDGDRVPELPPTKELFFELVMGAGVSGLRSLEQKMRRMPKNVDPFVSRPMYTFTQLRELAKHPLITLASHSMSHQNMGALPPKWCEWEIETARQYIAEVGGNTKMFAYPYGSPQPSDSHPVSAMKRAGVEYALTTCSVRATPDSLPFLVGRSPLVDCKDEHYLWGTAAGAMEWYHLARHPRCGCHERRTLQSNS